MGASSKYYIFLQCCISYCLTHVCGGNPKTSLGSATHRTHGTQHNQHARGHRLLEGKDTNQHQQREKAHGAGQVQEEPHQLPEVSSGDRQDVGVTCEMRPTRDSGPGLGIQVAGVSHTGSERGPWLQVTGTVGPRGSGSVPLYPRVSHGSVPPGRGRAVCTQAF